MSGCGGVSAADRRWAAAAEETGVSEGCVETRGKTAEQTKKSQKPTLTGGLAKTAEEAFPKAVSMATKGATAVTTGALSVLATGLAHVNAYMHAQADAAELRGAYSRDAVNLAIVWAASGALPSSYVQRMSYEMRAVGGEHGGASKILTAAMRNDKEWQAMKTEVERQAGFGRKIAMKSGITSSKELSSRLSWDKNFARAYNEGAAFRHGVNAYVTECDSERIARKGR